MWLPALLMSFPCAALTASHASPGLLLENRRVRVSFDPSTGALLQLTDLKTSRGLLVQRPGGTDLWKLALKAGGQRIELIPSEAGHFRHETRGRELRLRWDQFSPPVPSGFAVAVTVNADTDDTDTRWRITVEHPGTLQLQQVHFPRIMDVARMQGERLAVPQWMGQETTAPRRLLTSADGRPVRMEWAYPGFLSIQCVALYAPGTAGLYFASNDTEAFRRTFAVFGDGSGNLCLEQVHLPEQTSQERDRWTMPYESLVGVLHGDWMDAAAHYRSWASRQKWARQSRLRKRLSPQWLRDCSLWVWNRGKSTEAIDPALALKKRLNGRLAVYWHWWHGCAYDTGFPEYLPPREGTASFAASVSAAHQQGVPAIIYMNQRLWGMTTSSWKQENAERYAVKAADGKVQPEIYNTFTNQPCASMCMGTEFWRDKYSSIAAEALKDLKVDGIYMDQACSSLACYDSTHGHPSGGGRYWMEGFRKITAEIRGHSGRGNDAVLAGEGCGEPWLPYLDLMLSLEVSRERYSGPDNWEPIPFFHAVYHSDALLYGNYSSLTLPPYDELWPKQFAPKEPLKLLDRKYSKQFALEQARSFVWGQQLTVANFQPSHLAERAEEMDQVLRMAKVRDAAATYLRDGVFLRPPRVEVPETTIPMSRISIYAGRAGGGIRSFQKTVPQVLAGAWRAPDGSVGIALASIADVKLNAPLVMDIRDYGYKDTVQVSRTDQNGTVMVGPWRPSESLTVKLAPRDACVLVLAARSG